MTEVLVRGSHAPQTVPYLDMPRPQRVAVQGAITECLRIQASARRQSWAAWLFGVNPMKRDARSWYRAAQGELDISRTLSSLPDAWTVLHPSDENVGSDIDHLVIGPAGVFTITTKNHSGQRVRVGNDQLTVNDRRTHHIRDARYEAARASRLLSSGVGESIDAIPLIAIVDPGSLTFAGPRPAGVRVLAASQLGRMLSRARPVMTEAAVDALVVTAELIGHWHISALDGAPEHETRFARLKARVDAAARRRIGWLAGLGSSGALSAWIGSLMFTGA